MARLRNHPARLKLVLSDSAQQPSRATLSVREQPFRAVLSWAEQVGVMDWEEALPRLLKAWDMQSVDR